MLNYILRRILAMIPTLIGVTILVFLLSQLMPGDVVTQMLGTEGGGKGAKEGMQDFLGLGQPLYIQYFEWFTNMITGDFGQSWRTGNDVLPLIIDSVQVTAQLAIMAVIFSMLIGVPVGIIAALNPYGVLDNILRVISLAGVSIPIFFQGTVLILLFSLFFPWSPPVVFQLPGVDLSKNIQIMILPAIALGVASSSVIMRMTRSALLETLGENFIRTAKSKGLKEQSVIFGHALRNVWITVITALGIEFGQILGGIVVIEVVFSLPGMGQLIFNSLLERDFPIVLAGIVIIATITLIVNAIIDITYRLIDPRVRLD